MPLRTISRAGEVEEVEEVEEVKEVKEVKEVEEEAGTGRSACATGISRAGDVEEVKEVDEETAKIGCPTFRFAGSGGCSAVSFWISRMTWSGGRLRDLPRTKGIMQKEQRLLQPSWIFRMGRV